MSQALQSIIRIWINGIEVVEATDATFNKPRPIGQKFGAAGMIGKYRGQAGGRVELTFAQVQNKSQFETFAENAIPDNFVLVWTKGQNRFMMRDCSLGDTSMRGNYESGDTSVTSSVIGGEITQIV